jgi:hypothetical protein
VKAAKGPNNLNQKGGWSRERRVEGGRREEWMIMTATLIKIAQSNLHDSDNDFDRDRSRIREQD